jgi:aminoglycoside phosphotransferase (APT) family kinase protein
MAGAVPPRHTQNSVEIGETTVTKHFVPACAARWRRELDAYHFLSSSNFTAIPALLDAGERADGYFIQFERLSGPSLGDLARTAPPKQQEEYVGEVGRLAAAFHALALPSAADTPLHAIDAAEMRRRWTLTFQNVLPHLLARHVPQDIAHAIEARLAIDGPIIAMSRPASLVHRDLRFDNLIMDRGDLKLIDWEVSTVGHPDLEFSRFVWFELGDSPLLTAALARGYQRDNVFTSSSRRFFRLVYALEMLNWLFKQPKTASSHNGLLEQLLQALPELANS